MPCTSGDFVVSDEVMAYIKLWVKSKNLKIQCYRQQIRQLHEHILSEIHLSYISAVQLMK